jgi:hypothetical protein
MFFMDEKYPKAASLYAVFYELIFNTNTSHTTHAHVALTHQTASPSPEP